MLEWEKKLEGISAVEVIGKGITETTKPVSYLLLSL